MMDIYSMYPGIWTETSDVIDDYESLIWTERFMTSGDFEIKTYNLSKDMLQKCAPGQVLGITSSKYMMIVESNLITRDPDGKLLLTVKGRSLEVILETRVPRKVNNLDGSGVLYSYSDMTPVDIALRLYKNVILDETSYYPQFPGISFDWAGLASEKGLETSIQVEEPDLLTAIRNIITPINVGLIPQMFDLSRQVVSLNMHAVEDRSMDASDFPLVFSVANGDLINESYLWSNEGYYNAALVTSQTDSLFTYGATTGLPSGFQLRSMLVDVGKTPDNWNVIQKGIFLDTSGLSALSKIKKQFMFDGQLNKLTNTYDPDVDYTLGQLVTLLGDYDVNQTMRVEEIIRSKDQNGEIVYPTLVTPN